MATNRQKIKFEIKNGNIMLNPDIVSNDISILLPMLRIINKDMLIEIVVSSIQIYGMYIKSPTIYITDLAHIFDTIKIAYLKINDIIYIDKPIIEIYNDIVVTRQFNSFFQTNYQNACKIHDIILNENSHHSRTMMFIGGEMYFYGLLLKPYYDIGYFYSDFDSIIVDAKNNLDNAIIQKIDYKCDLLYIQKGNIIVNNGKSGLGKNLATQLAQMNANKICIISCNCASFARDYVILSKIYTLTKTYDIAEFPKLCVYVLINNINV